MGGLKSGKKSTVFQLPAGVGASGKTRPSVAEIFFAN
jgi:hypothetical protein